MNTRKLSAYLITTLAFVLASVTAFAQDITGSWYGSLKVRGTELRLVVNISKTDSGYSSTLDSPDQGAKGIPVTSTRYENATFTFEVASAGIKYQGTINKENAIIGTFSQMGQSFPLDLSREKIEKKMVIRPQEPTKPYAYYTEEVTFENEKDSLTLAGTLTLPGEDGPYPVVILISGSGAQNRDEELMGHKPFLVLADHLTKNGIAVLRYDDRGTAESTGDFDKATSEDFASDVVSAIKYLQTRKEINRKKIGLIGHSEGGIIAPMVAAKSKDVDFIVLLAGTGIPGHRLLVLQQELIGRAEGVKEEELKRAGSVNKGAFEIVAGSTNSDSVKIDLADYLKKQLKELPASEKPSGISEEEFVKMSVDQLTSPWMQFFIKYDPASVLKDVKCPVLALNGSKDLQVPPAINLQAIKKGLEEGENRDATMIELPNLNHLFQECETGSPSEYEKIEQTMAPQALNEITNWVLKQVK